MARLQRRKPSENQPYSMMMPGSLYNDLRRLAKEDQVSIAAWIRLVLKQVVKLRLPATPAEKQSA